MVEDRRRGVARDAAICPAQAVVAGTRVLVSVVLDCPAAGMTEAEIVSEYPALTPDGIRAVAAHGAERARDEYLAVFAP